MSFTHPSAVLTLSRPTTTMPKGVGQKLKNHHPESGRRPPQLIQAKWTNQAMVEVSGLWFLKICASILLSLRPPALTALRKCLRCKTSGIQCFVPKDPKKTTCRGCKEQKKACKNTKSKPGKQKRRALRAAAVSNKEMGDDVEAIPSTSIASIRDDTLSIRGMQLRLIQSQNQMGKDLAAAEESLDILTMQMKGMSSVLERLQHLF